MLQFNEIQTKLSEEQANKTKSNAEILDDTYYEYHGRYDDGDSPADAFDRLILKGVVVA